MAYDSPKVGKRAGGYPQSNIVHRIRIIAKTVLDYPARLGTHISPFAMPVDSEIDRTAALDSFVRFYRSNLGRYSYVGRGSYVESTNIGSFCSIAGDCQIGGGAHPLDHLSTSPVFCKGTNILGVNLANSDFNPFCRTYIENDVWIGHGVKVKSGITIATGAVIGMGSVLTKNVGPYEIWAGNPAHLIRRRFDEETIERLLDSRWWEWEDERIRSMSECFEAVCGRSDVLD